MTGRDEQGFTLVEVLVAVAILAIGLTAAFKLQAQGLDLIQAERNATRACLAAESLMWTWTAYGFEPDDKKKNTTQGTWDGLQYKAEAAPSGEAGGLEMISLELDDGPGREPAQEFQRLIISGEDQ